MSCYCKGNLETLKAKEIELEQREAEMKKKERDLIIRETKCTLAVDAARQKENMWRKEAIRQMEKSSVGLGLAVGIAVVAILIAIANFVG